MNCHACGAPETANDRYCPNCGALNTESNAFREERGAPVGAQVGEEGAGHVTELTDEDKRRAELRGGQAAVQSEGLTHETGAGLQVPAAFPDSRGPNTEAAPPGARELVQAHREASLVEQHTGTVVDPGAAREAQHMPPTAAPVHAPPAVETVHNQAPHPVRLGTVANNAEAPPVAGEPANDQGAPSQPLGTRPDKDVPPVTQTPQEAQRAPAADAPQPTGGHTQDAGAATPRTPTPIAPAPGAPLTTAP